MGGGGSEILPNWGRQDFGSSQLFPLEKKRIGFFRVGAIKNKTNPQTKGLRVKQTGGVS